MEGGEKMNICQSCEEDEEQWILTDCYKKSKSKPYHLCSNCLLELVNTCLSPEHLKNLIKNGHSDKEFYLHSDFYDKKGNALQPKL